MENQAMENQAIKNQAMKTAASIPLRPLALLAVSMIAAMCTATTAFGTERNDPGAEHNRGMEHSHKARGCARQFEVAQRLDMESFRDYDAETFRSVHDNRAVTVFASGASFVGIDAIMQALASHFGNREALWSWTEKYRVVDGCKSAFILYETVYEIPRIGFHQRALTGVTYSHDGRKWLAIADQGTLLP
jgi:hypothetical protein